jgi:hypothetical protein
LGRTTVELPENTSPTSSTELERLAKEQALGEATDLGRPRVETPGAIETAAESGPAKIPAKAATTGGGETAAVATAIARGVQAAAVPTSRSSGRRPRSNRNPRRENLIMGKENRIKDRKINRTEGRRKGESDEEIPYVGDGTRDDARIAWRMLLVGI